MWQILANGQIIWQNYLLLWRPKTWQMPPLDHPCPSPVTLPPHSLPHSTLSSLVRSPSSRTLPPRRRRLLPHRSAVLRPSPPRSARLLPLRRLLPTDGRAWRRRHHERLLLVPVFPFTNSGGCSSFSAPAGDFPGSSSSQPPRIDLDALNLNSQAEDWDSIGRSWQRRHPWRLLFGPVFLLHQLRRVSVVQHSGGLQQQPTTAVQPRRPGPELSG